MTKRLSLILPDADERVIERYTRPGTGEFAAVQRWAQEHGSERVASEAAALRVLLRAGVLALSDETLDIAYAALALTYHGDDAHRERRTARDRYVARTDAAIDRSG